jgi:hypothetical protein
MSQFDVIEALRVLGEPSRLEEIVEALRPDVPERVNNTYLNLTLNRMIANGKVRYNRSTQKYSLAEWK